MGGLLGDAIALIVGGDEDATRNEVLILVDSQGIGSPDKARQKRYIISRPRGSRTLLVGHDCVVVVDVYRLNGIRCLWLCRSPCYQQGRQYNGFSRYAHTSAACATIVSVVNTKSNSLLIVFLLGYGF